MNYCVCNIYARLNLLGTINSSRFEAMCTLRTTCDLAGSMIELLIQLFVIGIAKCWKLCGRKTSQSLFSIKSSLQLNSLRKSTPMIPSHGMGKSFGTAWNLCFINIFSTLRSIRTQPDDWKVPRPIPLRLLSPPNPNGRGLHLQFSTEIYLLLYPQVMLIIC